MVLNVHKNLGFQRPYRDGRWWRSKMKNLLQSLIDWSSAELQYTCHSPGKAQVHHCQKNRSSKETLFSWSVQHTENEAAEAARKNEKTAQTHASWGRHVSGFRGAQVGTETLCLHWSGRQSLRSSQSACGQPCSPVTCGGPVNRQRHLHPHAQTHPSFPSPLCEMLLRVPW